MSLPPDFADWASILGQDSVRWNAARAAAKNGPAVLIANSNGSDSHVTMVDSLLAVALTLRGAAVHFLVCDEALPACWISSVQKVPPPTFAQVGPAEKLCRNCFQLGSMAFGPLGLPIHRYHSLLSRRDLRRAVEVASATPLGEIEHLCVDGVRVGEHALAGVLRYYTRGDLRGEPEGEAILRRYLQAALVSTFAVNRLLRKHPFRSACAIHGMYVPDGILGEAARSQNVRMVSWNNAYLKQTFIFSQPDTHHRTLISEPIANILKLPWTSTMEAEIVEYLKSRWYGTHDWIKYTQDWSEDVSAIAAELGLDFSKPCVGLLTNVIWDAQLHYGGNAFSNMLEWVLETIKYFAKRPEVQLIVRVHPAELRGHRVSRQLMVDEIERAFPRLPKNVFVIPPDSRMNTYSAMLKCNAVIIYGTKAGVELTSFGVPVIVAGEASIRNKGLTLDASSPREYFEILDRLPLAERMSDEAVQRARRYAYHYFFRRQIPVTVFDRGKGNALTRLAISSLDDLLPGRDPGLDVICNGIINGDEFVYPAELYPETLATSGKFTASSIAVSVGATHRPLVSVIHPTRNRAGGLADALDSVAAQIGAGEQFDVEVIVVGNGATETASISHPSRRSGRLRYITVDQPSSLAAMRNAGVRAAAGQYVTFLDEETTWLPERLRSQLAVLERYPGFGAAYGQFVATGPGDDMVFPDAGSAPAGSVFKAFAVGEWAFPSFLTVRSQALRTVGDFDEALETLHDYDMALRLASAVQFAFVAGPFGTSRFADRASWFERIRRGAHQTELPHVLDKAFALLPDVTDRATLRRDVSRRWFTKIAEYVDQPESVEFLRAHLLHSIKEQPWIMRHPASRDAAVAYAAKVLAHVRNGSARLTRPAIRSFCHDIRKSWNGAGEATAVPIRRFLGDTLTRTATEMLAEGHVTTGGYLAAYAIGQDITQILRQGGGVSRRLARALLH
jgi:glycosyltransferase involved in cell wall biosynthesis